MVEEQIVGGCLRGDNAARQELYNIFSGRLLNLCRRYISDADAAQDVLHDSFIKIFSAIHTFSWRGDGSLRAWVERVTINMALEYLRKNGRASFTSLDAMPQLSQEPTAEQASLIPGDVLTSFIGELPDGYRTVFNLFCIEQYSHKEIAQMLGINEKSSSSQLFRARAMLAQKIKDYLTSRV